MAKGKCLFALLTLTAATLAQGPVAQAQPADSTGTLLSDRLTVSLGTFLLDTKTKVRVDGTAGVPGTDVDFSKDLGLTDKDRFRVDATWRFARHHKVRALYFDTSQSGTKTLDRDVTIGDTVYPVSGEVTSEVSFKVAELAYEYVFLQRENYELAGSAGIHDVKFNYAVSGQGSVNGQPGEFRKETAAANAPLPVFGLRGLWEFHPQWYLDGQFQYFSLKFDAYDGRLTDLRIAVTRMFGKHFGIGAGWDDFTTTVGVDKDSFEGNIKWRYSGAQVFATASF